MLDRPSFRPHLHVEVLRREGIVLLSETEHVVLPGALYALIAPLLDGRRTVAAIVAALAGEAEPVAVHHALEELERRALLTDAAHASDGEAVLWASRGIDPVAAGANLAAATVSVEALGGVDVEPFAEAAVALGVHLRPDASRRVVLVDDYLQPELARLNRAALESEREWLVAKPVGCVVWLGPLFRPGRTPCWECLAQRLAANRNVESFLAQRRGEAQPLLPLVSTPADDRIAASLVASAVAAWLARGEAPELESAVRTLDLRSWRSETHRVVWRPQCRACGEPPPIAGDAAAAIVLASRLKVFTEDGGHRTRTPEQTIERYAHHVSPISGAVSHLERNGTRRDGILHAYAAGSNLARPPQALAMLGDGLRSRNGGKGVSDAQARASALCEALERYSGVFRGEEPRFEARLADLGGAAIHPNACMGFSDRQYAERESWNERRELTQAVPVRFDEDAKVSWTPVWSLTRGETRYLPTAFCFFDFPMLPEATTCIACSNGNAAGNTLEEAILQGFLELVERDSVALWWYSRARRPAVALDGFDDPYLPRLQGYLGERGRELAILDLTSDLGIPVFAAVSRRVERLPEQVVMGFGAHLDPHIALLRAVTELVQMMMRVLRSDGGADTDDPFGGERSAREWLERATLAEHPYLAAAAAQPARRAADHARCWSEDLREDILFCRDLVERRGMEVLVLDQTRPDIGLPVVKVIVPGLRHFWPRFAPGRLYDVPAALGWVEEPLREDQLNPFAMFL